LSIGYPFLIRQKSIKNWGDLSQTANGFVPSARRNGIKKIQKTKMESE